MGQEYVQLYNALTCGSSVDKGRALTQLFLELAGGKFGARGPDVPKTPDVPNPSKLPNAEGPNKPNKGAGDNTPDSFPAPCKLPNSFSAETTVWTAEGDRPIAELEVGDLVWAYNELSGLTELYTITATIHHFDADLILLTIDDEELETTPEHPFYTEERGWVDAAALQQGEHIRRGDGSSGTVQSISRVRQPQMMYNLTVAEAHTFFVGDERWLVHNCSNKIPDAPIGNLRHYNDRWWAKQGIDPHMVKKEILGGNAQISRFDLWGDDADNIWILPKDKAAQKSAQPIFAGPIESWQ